MSHVSKFACSLAFVTAMIVLAGCSGDHGAAPPAASQPANTAQPPATDQPQAGSAAETPKVTEALATLSTEDRVLAVQQKICPVSGHPLGSMGTPKKVSVQGHDVFICCESCEQPLLDTPGKYLTKIGIESTDGPALK